jgi:hypothetical protein
MANERVILCGDADWPAELQGPKGALRLRLLGPDQNVSLRIEDISRSAATNITEIFADLLEIAAYVYCADQAVTRGGLTDSGVGEKWHRHLKFYIPVRHLDLWSSSEVSDCLTYTLGFLSADLYTFKFTKLEKPPPFERYLEGMKDTTLRPDGIVLFSGGLDSLAGAIQDAVLEKEQLILVSHRSAPKILAKQELLVKELAKHCTGPIPVHVPVWCTKHETRGKEYTQRTRSFLYAALGAAVASLFNLKEIRMYENGIVSLNLPISPQVIDARATRTTHPRALEGFAELFSLIMGEPFRVVNPFFWKTKTEVVNLIADAGCADLIKHSVSCTHVMEMTRGHTHCGKCSQCIDRRFGVLSSGNETQDPLEMYKVDLLTGAREDGEDKTMLESYVRMAYQISIMTDFEFLRNFPETSRVILHLPGTADEIATQIIDLYRRHAVQICTVINKAVESHVTAILAGDLFPSCLLILALPEEYRRPAEIPLAEVDKSRNIFRKEGDVWRIVYDGEVKSLKHIKGLSYLSILLRNPRRSFHVFDLVQEVGGSPYTEQIENFKQMGREKWEEEGLSLSRPKELADKARKAVYISIQRSLEKIKKEHPALGQHLKNSIKTSYSCSYTPDNPIPWEL